MVLEATWGWYWAAVESVARYRGDAPIRDGYQRIAQCRGTNIARVAAARKLTTLVFYGMRDGEIRCLKEAALGSDTATAASGSIRCWSCCDRAVCRRDC